MVNFLRETRNIRRRLRTRHEEFKKGLASGGVKRNRAREQNERGNQFCNETVECVVVPEERSAAPKPDIVNANGCRRPLRPSRRPSKGAFVTALGLGRMN